MRRSWLGAIGMLTAASWAAAEAADIGKPAEPELPPVVTATPAAEPPQRLPSAPNGSASPAAKVSPQPATMEVVSGLVVEACPVCSEPFCGPVGTIWATADYLLWWTKGQAVPPLVTTSPPGTARVDAGVLGVPGTTIVLGDDYLSDGVRSGGRFLAGMWLDRQQTIGLEGNFFFLCDDDVRLRAASGGTTILARPFYNAYLGRNDAQLVAYPDVLAGATNVRASNSFWGAGVLGIGNICCDCNYRLDLLLGYRFLKLDEDLNIDESLNTLGEQEIVPQGTLIFVNDNFNTNNQFHGGQIGLGGEYRAGRWFVGFRGSCAFGATYSVVEIAGSTTVRVPGQPVSVRRGGLLAQGTNIGRYSTSTFAVVPEIGLNLGFEVFPGLRLFSGYTLIYWSSVARPGDQIDWAVNPTQIPPGTLVGPARPAFQLDRSDFWAQGINFGVELRY
ncbi:MAG: BBP7 family outer membrane beta-barrel protein [Gemmataceae bacterium]|nr:BBP7 family outer membrane beta-barrel protein [Gemmataceae bacterium]MDW8266889.1 BBP7 family outer membrane beta-barrel protein [Gemmataceae bacterium]